MKILLAQIIINFLALPGYIILLDSLHYAKASLTWIFSRSFSMPCVSFSMLGGSSRTVPPGPPSIENGAHGIEKLLLKIQISEDFA